MISVVIPAHNEEALIGRAIDSLVNSVSDVLEIVVVLDRCTDATAEVVRNYKRDQIRAVPNVGPPGLAGALNTGLAESRGNWVARLDADDVCHPNRFERQLALIERDSLDVCCGWARLVDEYGRERLVQATPLKTEETKTSLRRGNTIVHSSVLMNRARVLGYGGYRNTRWEDYDLWIRLAAAGFRFGCVYEIVVTRQFRAKGYGEKHGKGMVGRLEAMRLRLTATVMSVSSSGK